MDDNKTSVSKKQIVEILGVKIDIIDMYRAVEQVCSFVQSGTAHIIVTADAYNIVTCKNDPEFKKIVNNADLVTADGAGILKGSKILGCPIPYKVSGIDLLEEICKTASKEGFGVYLLGAAPTIAEKAAEKLKEKYPGLIISGVRDGYFTETDEEKIVNEIKSSGAKVLFVGMGIPKQEKWISKHLDNLGVSVAMGVGGSFDVISGNIQRAPKWMQKHGLEWLYRIIKDPKKIYKVSVLPKFVMMVYKEKLFGKKG
ncbi:MAG: WecB/TagA/CpsF family glycosyltransferase [Armatimonadota bacterium]